MLQLFLKTANITDKDWSKAYGKIVELAEAFPLRLMRIESYNGFERDQQDKDHFDLTVNRGQVDEHLSFYGDYMSWTTGTSIRFYKNWSKHCELELEKANSNPKMPITWYLPTPFKDDGSLPETNGESTKCGYIDVRGAMYKYVIIAIGILLKYPPHEHFFIKKAILKNPAYFKLDEAVNDLCRQIWKTTVEGEHMGYVAQIRAESGADKKALILHQLKKKRDVVTAGPNFENWLNVEEDPDVLLFLRLLLSLKIYDRWHAYARYRILHDKTLWNLWQTGEK